MLAGGAVHLYKVARPEILNPRRVQGEHPAPLMFLRQRVVDEGETD
jgi:hypothetical protein